MQPHAFLPKNWQKITVMVSKGLIKLTFKKLRRKWYYVTVDLNHRNDLTHVSSI